MFRSRRRLSQGFVKRGSFEKKLTIAEYNTRKLFVPLLSAMAWKHVHWWPTWQYHLVIPLKKTSVRSCGCFICRILIWSLIISRLSKQGFYCWMVIHSLERRIFVYLISLIGYDVVIPCRSFSDIAVPVVTCISQYLVYRLHHSQAVESEACSILHGRANLFLYDMFTVCLGPTWNGLPSRHLFSLPDWAYWWENPPTFVLSSKMSVSGRSIPSDATEPALGSIFIPLSTNCIQLSLVLARSVTILFYNFLWVLISVQWTWKCQWMHLKISRRTMMSSRTSRCGQVLNFPRPP